jgi:hypothetical protein
MSTRFTEKTVRINEKWVKITRDNEGRTFTFAKGFQGQYQAYDVVTLSFKWVPNWQEAVWHAERYTRY